MPHQLSLALVLCATAIPRSAGSQEPAASGTKPQAQPAQPPRETRPAPRATPDYKVVFWFGRDGWKNQVYDVRKGQYTKAVDDWVNYVEVDPSGYVLPGRMATVRDVYLNSEKGRTEQEKLASAIERFQAGILGVGKTPEPRPYPRFHFETASPSERRAQPPRLGPLSSGRPPGMAAPLELGPSGSRFPFPFPYPRPHP
jgi:hypothetical protein